MFETFSFNPHSIPVFLAAFATLGLGIVMRVKRPDLALSKHFLVFCLGVFTWLFCTAMGYLASIPDMALRWFHWDNAGVMFISPSFFAFSVHLTHSTKKRLIYFGYALASLFAILAITTNFPAIGVTHYWWGFFPRWSIIKSVPFFLFFFGFMLGAFQLLRGALKTVTDPADRLQIRYVLGAFVIAYGGSVDYLPTFGYSFYPFGYIAMVGFAFILFYAVLKHRLLNIELVLRDTTLHALTACIVGFVAWLCAFPTVTYSPYSATILSIVLTLGLMMFAYDPLRRVLQPAIDRLIFANRFAYLEELGQLPNDMLEFTNLREMLKFLVTRLTEAAKLERVRILMYDPGHQSYVETIFHSANGRPDETERPRDLSENSSLVQLLRQNKRLLIEEDLTESPTGRTVASSDKVLALTDLKSLDGTACFPVMKERELLGLVVLGRKRSGEPFNQQDLKILDALRARLENFLGQAMVITQEALNMVKDSHDMKNDVNALKGRVTWRAMRIAGWKMDFEKQSQILEGAQDPEQMRTAFGALKAQALEWFQEADRSRSIEDQAIGRLSHRLKNWAEYGRVISEGFRGSRAMEAIEVGETVKNSVERWKPHAEKKNLQLSAEAESHLVVWGERSLVEQVVENLIDNAIKATSQGTVNVACRADREGILLEVRDSGCGIPPEDLKTIFEKPFYQGKGRETLEQSTGVGLYLVSQYVRSLGGRVWAESAVDKGSSFFVQLPRHDQARERTGAAA